MERGHLAFSDEHIPNKGSFLRGGWASAQNPPCKEISGRGVSEGMFDCKTSLLFGYLFAEGSVCYTLSR
jgi:hypothetical protein